MNAARIRAIVIVGVLLVAAGVLTSVTISGDKQKHASYANSCPAGTVPPPDVSTQLKRGKYLVTIAGCQGCHTATLAGGDKFGFPGVTVVSANITPDTHSGIGKLSEQDFVNKFAQYRDYVANGSPKAGLSSFTIMPWLQFCQLPDDDLRAIYAYIHTFPPVNKPVETHPGFDKGLDKPKEKS